MARSQQPEFGTGIRLTRRGRRWAKAVGAVAVVCLAIGIVGSGTPWPSAMLIRSVFEAGGRATAEETAKYVPDTPLDERLGVAYGTDSADETLDADMTLDVFSPKSATGPLPTVVWVHGGAWISGDSSNVDPYLRVLASHGYTTIGLNYTLGPEATYPTAVVQLNDAMAYINDNAADLRVDTSQIVLAGDSAGSQLASQLAVLATNSDYEHLLGMTSSLDADQLAGIVLNCGVYDMSAMAELTGIVNWGFKISLWAYTGTKDWAETYAGSTMSTINFVNEDFPTTYISGGNGDGLTWLQSIPMANALKAQGVDVTELFWEEQHRPALPHEYQFHLDSPDAQTALKKTIGFLDGITDAVDPDGSAAQG
ncbi:hypothetical protein GCM10027416_18550 [Okibacterium endophyticum]